MDVSAVVLERFGYAFEDKDLLRLALTHPSLVTQQQGRKVDNQRLEFLGDAVLGLLIVEELYRRHDSADEGMLTPLKAELVSGRQLAALARQTGLDELLRLGQSAERSGGRQREGALADVWEALMAAVYLDGGMEQVRRVFLGYFVPLLEAQVPREGSINPKGRLQEILQDIEQVVPLYEVVEESGAAHERLYVVEVCWRGQFLGRGEGARKKEAEAQAARHALELRLWGEGA